MIAARMKSAASYILILIGGLAVGIGIAKLPEFLEKPYQQGNYAAYYPDARTRVVVYGTSTCPFCAQTRDYLNRQKIAYADFNVDQSPQASRQFAALHGSAVPVILIGDRLITGFKPQAIDAALKALGR